MKIISKSKKAMKALLLSAFRNVNRDKVWYCLEKIVQIMCFLMCILLFNLQIVGHQNHKMKDFELLVDKDSPEKHLEVLIDDLEIAKEYKNMVMKKCNEGALLGESTYGYVTQINGLYFAPTKQFACKKMIIQGNDSANFQTGPHTFFNDIALMVQMDHKNIQKLRGWTYNGTEVFYLIFDLYSGYDFYDYFDIYGPFSECQAAKVYTKIFDAAIYFQNRYVCHRDFKVENFMFVSNQSFDNPVVIDWQFARPLKYPGEILSDSIGSIEYKSPEHYNKSYAMGTDTFALGVNLYFSVCNYRPFNGDAEEMKRQILNLEYDWSKRTCIYQISDELKDLVAQLLQFDVKNRGLAKKYIDHPWFEKFKSCDITENPVKKMKKSRAKLNK